MQRAWTIGLAMVAVLPAAADDKPKTKPAEFGGVTWQVPAEWLKQQPKRAFRILEWGIPTAEGDENAPVLYVSELSGGGGGVKPNINRWLGEFEEKSGDPKEEEFEVEGIKVATVAIVGTFKESAGGPFAGGKTTLRKDYATLAAVVQIPGSEALYTVKMVGPKKSVEAQKKAFKEMLKSGKKGA